MLITHAKNTSASPSVSLGSLHRLQARSFWVQLLSNKSNCLQQRVAMFSN